MIHTPRVLVLLPGGGLSLVAGIVAGMGQAARVVALVPSLAIGEADSGGGRIVADLAAGLPVADCAVDMVAVDGITPADPTSLLDEACRVLTRSGQVVFTVTLAHLRQPASDLPGLTDEDARRIGRAVGAAVAEAPHPWDPLIEVMSTGRPGLHPADVNMLRMTADLDHQGVEEYLYTSTPVGPSPVAAVRVGLDARVARRYAAACHRAVDVHGALRLHSPVMFLRAQRAA
ncbi:hypothetical protein ThrDRAFT_03154 [Frankia casuarinae]|jgi:hypothetical protein|uniref:Methyltransferase type 11 domain-containing protein n=1 Tax=Frankia casuarinae (strain DSM 45818 / CECT 9043 / HFP020203 / CcI3) TaxID=106370 RepID=Q2JC22_FRACC|nr:MULTISPECIES: hypothetical protein [Frankia]ABD11170.1 hypothetical protein Francci3_1794 [Frankia casuarinae]ETA00825.1 hypothetical protein CcI6DRAFT_03766 [Frankia sp. CcI6]EYT91227.1 hypothetical protein ThrDRAFT_03154 [Frankia casuarinae]KFB03379.1 hypothetical protein ALLO2DRAFT_03883 [Frankia sp. Allo2]OAA21479.1 hypothetical protein AAY23_107618 [Frankia casuarinae]